MYTAIHKYLYLQERIVWYKEEEKSNEFEGIEIEENRMGEHEIQVSYTLKLVYSTPYFIITKYSLRK